MKNLLTITILYLLLSISQAWSLPPCEGEESKWQNCEGSLTSKLGTMLGVFKDGIFVGKSEARNIKYVGEYKDGTLNGQGTYTFPDGAKYLGDWKDGDANGQGIFTNADGSKYIGEFKDGMEHGQGTYTFPDGTKYVGEFKDGMLVKYKKYKDDILLLDSEKANADREAKLRAEQEAKAKAEQEAKLRAEQEAKLGRKRKNDGNIFVSSKEVVSAAKPGKRMKEFFLRNKNLLF